jgi:hypothetical protein
MEIQFTTQIFTEGRAFVARTRELDLSSCGGRQQKALQNLKEAARLFLEEAEKSVLSALEQLSLEEPRCEILQIAAPSLPLVICPR